MIHLATVSNRGQITLPIDLRKSLDLVEGDQIILVKTNSKAIMQPIKQASITSIMDLYGSVDSGRKTTDPEKATKKARNIKYRHPYG
ncbi:MAG: AbrB/MazE/SpoVT family DNA-binding domain-containing protein [Patescibacteria group bacterium]